MASKCESEGAVQAGVHANPDSTVHNLQNTIASLVSHVQSLRATNQHLVSRLSHVTDENRQLLNALDHVTHPQSDCSEQGFDAFCVIGSDGLVQEMSEGLLHLLGYHRENVVGMMHFTHMLTPETLRPFVDLLRTLVPEADSAVLELAVVNKDRQGVPMRVNARARPNDAAGNAQGFRLSLKDLTEIRELQARCRQLQKREAIGPFLGGIAHDFNNILSSILCYSDLALQSVSDERDTKHCIEESRLAACRARDLVKQILCFLTQREGASMPVQLKTILEEAAPLLRASLPATIDLRETITTDAEVCADSTQLHQVLMNLCTNAEYAMRETGGVLELRLDEVELGGDGHVASNGVRSGSYVRLVVSDTGDGIDEVLKEQIFDPFFTTKGKEEGSGLGLSVVREIVERVGGFITVEPKQESGSEFTVCLPRADSPTIETHAITTPMRTGRERILFIDDEEPLARLGKAMLEPLGYSVVAQTSALDALDLFLSDPEQFDLVITDATMPQMTGHALSRKLLHICPDLPIILCTGFSHTVSVAVAEDIGIRAFLMKPVLADDLAAAIRRVCDAEV